MARTKTTTFNKTIIKRILRKSGRDFWNRIFIVGDFFYFTNGYQMVKCLPSLIDTTDPDITVVSIDDLTKKDKDTIKDLIKIFDTAISGIKNKELFRLNRITMKSVITEKQKEFKASKGENSYTATKLLQIG